MVFLPTLDSAQRPRPDYLDGGPKDLFIDGEWTPAREGATVGVVDPTAEKELTAVTFGGAADVDRAVAAARRAFESSAWRSLTPRDRGRMLGRIAAGLDACREELAVLESLSNGTPLSRTRWQMASAVEVYEYYAGWPTKHLGTTYPAPPSVHAYSVREPLGVCAGITPWNSPQVSVAWNLAPVLACGNAMILKPAEQTPLTTLPLGQVLAEADLPPGIVTIVCGEGPTVGAAIAEHSGIDKVAFTGSTAVGKRILGASAAGNLKRVTLELGGKSPNIIFADADLTRAAAALTGFTALSGQACVAGSRIFVEASVRDEFVAALAAAAERKVIGDPFHGDTECGPLASALQRDRVRSYLDIGLAEGATAVTGGRMIDSVGYFVEPTVLTDVTNDMRVAREEIFGPVAVLIEVVRLANDTRYGLAAGVFTQDASRAQRMVGALEAGTVWVNTYMELDVAVPFGGYKDSGLGHELGPSRWTPTPSPRPRSSGPERPSRARRRRALPNPSSERVMTETLNQLPSGALLIGGESFRVGDPFAEETLVGPVVTRAAHDWIFATIDDTVARQEGRVVAGGERLGRELANGFYVPPTIFADVDRYSTLARTETFAPVASVFRFWINRFGHIVPTHPYGGYKQSGSGRAGGLEGLREFQQTKTIRIGLS
jgi:phenylacetaldehyde dehydrogenase